MVPWAALRTAVTPKSRKIPMQRAVVLNEKQGCFFLCAFCACSPNEFRWDICIILIELIMLLLFSSIYTVLASKPGKELNRGNFMM